MLASRGSKAWDDVPCASSWTLLTSHQTSTPQALRDNEELRLTVGEGPSAALLEAEGDDVKPVRGGCALLYSLVNMHLPRPKGSAHSWRPLLLTRLAHACAHTHAPTNHTPAHAPAPFHSTNKQALKAAFTALMTADSGRVAGAIGALVARLEARKAAGAQAPVPGRRAKAQFASGGRREGVEETGVALA